MISKKHFPFTQLRVSILGIRRCVGGILTGFSGFLKRFNVCGFCLFLALSSSSLFAETTISRIPAGGLTIDQPGNYVFTNDIKWYPSGDGQAILVTANDVTIDMRHFKLINRRSGYSTIGIVAQGVENFTLAHGTIKNMNLGGIKCDSCLNVEIAHMVVDGLSLDNTATYTVPVGILVSSSLNATVHKCKVENIDVKTGSTAAIQMSSTLGSVISDCHVKNLMNRDGACTGIGHLLCDIAEVRGCHIEMLQSQFIDNLNTEGHTAIGIFPFTTTNLLISDCHIKNIVGCCDDAHWMSIFECASAIVEKCKVENVVDGLGAAQSGAKATGIEVYASFVLVNDCKVKNITAVNPQDKQATGFSCAQCLGVAFNRCHAKNVRVVDSAGRQNPELGYGTGFGWAPDPRPIFIEPAIGILYQDCEAEKCQVGFDTWFHIDSLWIRIISRHNQIPILNKLCSQRSLSCNPCSECGCTATGCYPVPIAVTTIDNVASNNTFVDVTVID